MARNEAEFRLQCAVAEHLRLLRNDGVYYTAIPMGEHRSKKAAARVKAMGGRAGAPDILVIVHGVAYGLELKAAKGRQSEVQAFTEREWNMAGGAYAIATGIDEALNLLRRWGALPAP